MTSQDEKPNNGAVPEMPKFTSVAAERRHRKERLAGAFRIFARFGFGFGLTGHITVRDPGDPTHFWVNPLGMPYGQIRVRDLIKVDEEARVVEGSGILNGAAFAIHSQIHAARPEVVAAAHAHSTYGVAWSSLGRALDPVSQDSCCFFEDHAVFKDFTGVVYDTSEGRQIVAALGARKAVILENHGLLTVGQSVDEAAWWFVCMERACQVQLLAESAGKPKSIAPDMARHTAQQVGGHFAGWYSFQILWESIRRECPDLFD